MSNRILLVAAIVLLGAVSGAQAANDNQSRNRGGADIGPMGQCFVPPDCGRDYRYSRYRYDRFGYGYEPRYDHRRNWRYER